MSLAAVAGATAAAAYLDAKYHIRKDVDSLWTLMSAERGVQKAIATKRVSIWYFFEDAVKKMPAYQTCLWSRERIYTWRQAYDQSNRYAHFLLSCGVRPGETVSFYLTNTTDFPLFNLACWAIGTAPCCLNHNLGGDALLHCLRLGKSKVLLVDEDSEIRQRVEELRATIEGDMGIKIVVVDAAFRRSIAMIAPERLSNKYRDVVQGSWPAWIIFTSGTTGFPKAVAFDVARTWRSQGERVRKLGLRPGPGGDVWYDCMPLYHGTGGNVASFCLTSGVTLAIGKRFRVSTFWDDVRDSGSTAFVYVGETARYLLAAPPSPRDKDNKVHLMFGNGLRPDVWRKFRDRFGITTVAEFFNSTEGVFTLFNQCRGDFLATAVGHHGLIVRLISRSKFAAAVTDPESNKDLLRSKKPPHLCVRSPLDVGGEMLVAVPGTSPEESGFAGYMGNEKSTSEKFARNVFQEGDIWYRSGDALRRDADGRWYFLDRLGDTFRWKSENVSTAEVATAMGEFPGILEANVYGILVPGHDGRAGCAAVYTPNGVDGINQFDWKGLVAYLRTKLPRYALPVFIRVLSGEIKAGMHNMKQNKVGLRDEGADPAKLDNSPDKMLWLPPGADAYEEFTKASWEQLAAGRARL